MKYLLSIAKAFILSVAIAFAFAFFLHAFTSMTRSDLQVPMVIAGIISFTISFLSIETIPAAIGLSIVKAFILSVAIVVAFAFFLHAFTRVSRYDMSLLMGIVGIISFTISFLSIEIISAAIGAVRDIKEKIESNLEDKYKKFYVLVEDEYDNGEEIDKELWSQAFVNAKGYEKLRKVEYMKLRAKELEDKYKK